ncbi:MAG: TrkH family potassium uptake protein [Puniceicoccales bacterium]|jgi:trk system potassium uptake protein TrkH|nr:TrkH family potassium uptake protein [Puniceicoccales bacterium]
MNFLAILRMISFILFVVSGAFFFCGICDAFFFGNRCNGEMWMRCTEIAVLVTILFWGLSIRSEVKIFRREALATVGLGWIAVSIMGALPYVYICHVSFFDALFESTSGITTTGMSLFPEPEKLGQGILLWRALSQWIGGLGIAVFFMAMTTSMGTTAKQIFSNESYSNRPDLGSGKLKNNIFALFKIYSVLTLSCILVLLIFRMSLFDAVCHALATVSTGGFSTHSDGIAHFHSIPIELAITFFMVLSGTNFAIFIHLTNQFYRKIYENEEVRIYYILLVVGSLITAVMLYGATDHLSFLEALGKGLFHVTSAITSCGLTTCNFSDWIPSTHIILLLLMLCGGCTGSTAGGIKIYRVIIAIKEVFNGLINTFRPRIVRNVYFSAKIIEPAERESVMGFIVLFLLLFLSFLCAFVLIERQWDFTSVVSTVTALFSNSGMPILSPQANLADLSAVTKVIASLIMILGRVELYSVLLLFMPMFWKRYS